MNWIRENLLAFLSLLLNVVALALIGLILLNQNQTKSSLTNASKQMKEMAEGAANKQDDLGPKIGLLDTSLNKIDLKLGQLGTKLNEVDAKLVRPETKPASVDAKRGGVIDTKRSGVVDAKSVSADVKLLNRISSKLDKIDSRLADIQAASHKIDSKTTQVDDAIKEMKKQARANRNYVFP
ncbi:MAG: hypothetical protein LLG15_13185 [Betaproteobacteria bacterium]|nr:hypothetical protein [Betaproteobacteria bacterium]